MNNTTQAMKKYLKLSVQLSIASSFLILTACGGSGGGNTPAPGPQNSPKLFITNTSSNNITFQEPTSDTTTSCFATQTVNAQTLTPAMIKNFNIKTGSCEETILYNDRYKTQGKLNLTITNNQVVIEKPTQSGSIEHTGISVSTQDGNQLTYADDTQNTITINNTSDKDLSFSDSSHSQLGSTKTTDDQNQCDYLKNTVIAKSGTIKLYNPATNCTLKVTASTFDAGLLTISGAGTGKTVTPPSLQPGDNKYKEHIAGLDDNGNTQNLIIKNFIKTTPPGTFTIEDMKSPDKPALQITPINQPISYAAPSPGTTACFADTKSFTKSQPVDFTIYTVKDYSPNGTCSEVITFPVISGENSCTLGFTNDVLTTVDGQPSDDIDACVAYNDWKTVEKSAGEVLKETTKVIPKGTTAKENDTTFSIGEQQYITYPLQILQAQVLNWLTKNPDATLTTGGNIIYDNKNELDGHCQAIDPPIPTGGTGTAPEGGSTLAQCLTSEDIAHQMVATAALMRLDLQDTKDNSAHQGVNDTNYKLIEPYFLSAYNFTKQMLFSTKSMNGLLGREYDIATPSTPTNIDPRSLTDADMGIATAEWLASKAKAINAAKTSNIPKGLDKLAKNMIENIYKYDRSEGHQDEQSQNIKVTFLNMGGCNTLAIEDCYYNAKAPLPFHTTTNPLPGDPVPNGYTKASLPFMYLFNTIDSPDPDGHQQGWNDLISNDIFTLWQSENSAMEFSRTWGGDSYTPQATASTTFEEIPTSGIIGDIDNVFGSSFTSQFQNRKNTYPIQDYTPDYLTTDVKSTVYHFDQDATHVPGYLGEYVLLAGKQGANDLTQQVVPGLTGNDSPARKKALHDGVAPYFLPTIEFAQHVADLDMKAIDKIFWLNPVVHLKDDYSKVYVGGNRYPIPSTTQSKETDILWDKQPIRPGGIYPSGGDKPPAGFNKSTQNSYTSYENDDALAANFLLGQLGRPEKTINISNPSTGTAGGPAGPPEQVKNILQIVALEKFLTNSPDDSEDECKSPVSEKTDNPDNPRVVKHPYYKIMAGLFLNDAFDKATNMAGTNKVALDININKKDCT